MATPLYLRTTWSGSGNFGDSIWRAGNAARSVTYGDLNFLIDSAIEPMSTTIGTGTGVSIGAGTVNGPTAGRPVGQRWMSNPLAADVTISGTITANICGSESAMAANAGFHVKLFRIDKNGTLSVICDSESGSELTTSLARQSWNITPTSTAMKKGDRFLLAVMANDAGGTMATGNTVTCNYNGSNANTADSNLTFTETITFNTTAPAGSTYYLRSTAHGSISGGKMLSTTIGASAATAVHTTIAGPATFPGDPWTDTAGGSDVAWYTPPLDAFTLSDLVFVKVQAGQVWESGGSVSPFDITIVELAVCDADGTNATVFGTSYQQAQTAANGGFYIHGGDLSVGQGKILRFRFLQMDGNSNSVSGTNRTVNYNDSAANNKDVLIQLSQTVTEATTGPTGTAVVKGEGKTYSSGQKGGQAIAAGRGSGSIIAIGVKGGESIALIKGGGSLVSVGMKEGRGRNIENQANWSENLAEYVKWPGGARVGDAYFGGYPYGITMPSVTVNTPKATSQTGFFSAVDTATTGQHGYGKAMVQKNVLANERINYREYRDASNHAQDWFRFEVFDGSKAGGVTRRAWFQWSTKSWGTVDANLTVSAKADANGYWLFEVSWLAVNDGGTDYQYMDVAMSTADNSTATYLGVITSSINTWGRQFWAGDQYMPYLPTVEYPKWKTIRGQGEVHAPQIEEIIGGANIVNAQGRVISSGQKAAFGTASIRSQGGVISQGRKDASSTAVIRGSGRTISLGNKSASSFAIISSSGRAIATGQKNGQASALIRANGRTIATGQKNAVSIAFIKGSGAIVSIGTKAASSIAIISGSGRIISAAQGGDKLGIITGSGRVITTVGIKAAFGTARLSASGTVQALGTAAKQGVVSANGQGRIITTGQKNATSVALLNAQGRVIGQGATTRQSYAILNAQGKIVASGFASGPFVPDRFAVISGEGRIIASGSRGAGTYAIISANGNVISSGLKSSGGPAMIPLVGQLWPR